MSCYDTFGIGVVIVNETVHAHSVAPLIRDDVPGKETKHCYLLRISRFPCVICRKSATSTKMQRVCLSRP